ncbi:MAG: phosphoenolpyruvate synthase [Proteobacteria bacterium]|nr:phosphoenolpyruvate synthase [Pseudomonadota bacterium]
MTGYIAWLDELTLKDIDKVGGKNASLGEMINHLAHLDIRVPGGFATTATAYRDFLEQSGLNERIYKALTALNVDDIAQLTETGKKIRQWIMDTPLLPELKNEISEAYHQLEKKQGQNITVAVRSSATAEDLPEASFAGQQETFLNVHGLENILTAVKQVFASLFNDRAIAYRVHHGFDHAEVALSAGIQRMIRSDLASSGVMFTLDTESGFNDVVFITASYGLGETVVQGAVNPDEFYVYKPSLKAKKSAILHRGLGSKAIKMIYPERPTAGKTVTTVQVDTEDQHRFCVTDKDIEQLAHYAMTIEAHYGRPMDIEWAKDGVDQQLYIVQARPETVKSRSDAQSLERYELKKQSAVLAEGRSIGQRIGKGSAKIILNIQDMDQLKPGDVLIADMTDPDWEPIMKKASAIVTNRGGRTCHAAIIARELGIPAVVGTGDATHRIKNGDSVTVSCSEGDTGFVYQGLLDFDIKRINVDSMPKLPVKIMLNVGNPARAFGFRSVPNAGIGLARLEFLISNTIGIHPKALLNFDRLDEKLKKQIQVKIAAYESPVEYYIEKLREGISTLAAAFHPHPVIVRLSDFKSNEYANLLGGSHYEPHEENPMLGFRGASRYVSPEFMDCFALECEAVKRVRNEMGLTNVEVMIPFVRTVTEAMNVTEVLKKNGLERGINGLRVIMMCELPSNALLADEFLKHFDGFSIGSNDLTQLTLGLDRDSGLVAQQFDERNAAVKSLLSLAIKACKKANKYIGICGQGPSDHRDFAEWLVKEGIDSLSLNPDSVIETCLFLAEISKG